MLKKIINSAHINLKIIPVDPLLIKSSQATVGGVDMSFVRTYRFGEKDEPYIPGSSLKGMIRSYGEKICRSLRDSPVPVCLPYVDYGKEQEGQKGQTACGLRFEKYKRQREVSAEEVYRLSCPACRLFGSHNFIGRFAASDAYLTEAFKTKRLLEIRDGVAIDRITGGTAGGAKYDLEVLTSSEFYTTLEIRNFERWQLGLIGLILRDMEQGLLRIGYGKSRGLGRIQAEISEFKLTYYNKKVSHLAGIHALSSVKDRENYKLFNEITSTSTSLPEPQLNGLRYEYLITDKWKEILEPGVSDLVSYIEKVDWPSAIERII